MAEPYEIEEALAGITYMFTFILFEMPAERFNRIRAIHDLISKATPPDDVPLVEHHEAASKYVFDLIEAADLLRKQKEE